MDYLHTNQIVHRDLKLANFLLNNRWHVLITDFGFSVLKPGTSNHTSQTRLNKKDKKSDGAFQDPLYLPYEPMLQETICGTPEYMSPELYAIQFEYARYEQEKV